MYIVNHIHKNVNNTNHIHVKCHTHLSTASPFIVSTLRSRSPAVVTMAMTSIVLSDQEVAVTSSSPIYTDPVNVPNEVPEMVTFAPENVK